MLSLYVIGFILGICSAIFFACYMVPQKLIRMDNTTFLWVMSLGVLLTALIPYVLAGCPHRATPVQIGLAMLCGMVWCLGTLSFAHGIQRIGMALATPIKNTTGILGTLVGLLAFQEWKTIEPRLCLLGSALIVVAAMIIGQTGRGDVSRRSSVAGVIFSLLAALCYASYLYPMKLVVVAIGNWEFVPWMAAGILLTATVALLIRPDGVRNLRRYRFRDHALATLGGAAWAIALYCLNGSLALIGLSVAWSLAQLNTIPAVFFGIVLFHEISPRAQWPKLVLGLLAATTGTILLGMAK